MKNINELLKEYEKNNDLLYRFEDYTHSTDSYLGDIISEIADSETEIYYSGLIDWLKNDHDSVDNIEYALREFGTPTSRNDVPDFMKILQQGQYYGNEQKLWQDKNTACKVYLLAYLRDIEKLETIPETQAEIIDNLDFDDVDKLQDIIDLYFQAE